MNMSGRDSDVHRGRVRDSRPRGHNGGPPPSNRGWGVVNSGKLVQLLGKETLIVCANYERKLCEGSQP